MIGISNKRRMMIAGAAVGLAVTLGYNRLAAARRRKQLERREIRELRSTWTTVNGCRIHARVSTGRRSSATPPVVLVHGFGISSSYFLPTAERLAVEFDVYAPDLPGHGKSDTPADPLVVPRLADSLIGWMDALGLHRAAIVGHSMGCQIAVDAAARHPARVDRLVLIGPAVDPAARTLPRQVARLIAGGLYERVSLSTLLLADYVRMGPRLIPEFTFMLRNRIEEKLPVVTAPVMLVRGENDLVVPQRWFEQAARMARAERTVVIPGWGHAVNYSAAAQLVEAVAPFLRGTTRGSVERTSSC